MTTHYQLHVHEAFMSRALNLAAKGIGLTSPNPMVGCVLVKDDKIIGEGFHEKYGGSHAEVIALKNSTEDPVDSIAYVTLEPCFRDTFLPNNFVLRLHFLITEFSPSLR